MTMTTTPEPPIDVITATLATGPTHSAVGLLVVQESPRRTVIVSIGTGQVGSVPIVVAELNQTGAAALAKALLLRAGGGEA